ncbi:MAG TPA: hypothetical protein DCL15_16065 [Chloroflexi bacterium]|nr:hypothetical protein [Chloroflexota bacterium]HHW86523.1 hypothetical protein [Chloroflexota bacterium]
MQQPYSRVLILHVVVLAGGYVVRLLGQPMLALVLLIVLKTGFDLRAHLRQHGRLEAARASARDQDGLNIANFDARSQRREDSQR